MRANVAEPGDRNGHMPVVAVATVGLNVGMRERLVVGLLAAVVVGACGGATSEAGTEAVDRLSERLVVVAAHVEEWRAADTLSAAQRAAEAAANHIVGPNGPGFGDRDGDGEVRGPSDAGVLPGSDGSPPGFALGAVAAGAPDCVVRVVLGGDWSDPVARWAEMESAIARWSPDGNTFPALPSHAQRVVGWASLTLATDSLELARTYAGHAQIHVNLSQRAVNDCR